MLETSARLLRLLSLFQARRDWTGGELAERLGVTTRTVRNDVERLRELGYPVQARPGVAGGYALGSGAALPPLSLDDDEAVAVVLGLRIAAGGAVTGIEETSLSALAKLQRILPARLRHRVEAGALESEPESLTAWQTLAALTLTQKGEWRKPKGITKALGPAYEAKAATEALRDSLERVSEVLTKDLRHAGIVYIGRAETRDRLFSRVVHLIKDPALRRLPRKGAPTAAAKSAAA